MLKSFITVQIALLYCWDWNAEISTIIYNCPHWNRRVFRMWGYRDSITTFVIRKTRLLNCLQWKWESLQRAYVGRDLVVMDIKERKGLRSSLRSRM